MSRREGSMLRLFLLLVIAQLAQRSQSTTSSQNEFLPADEILKSHNRVQDAPTRNYMNLTIFGFVTPWNSKGTEVSLVESERGRLDMASPVTYQVIPAGIKGGHDYSSTYYDKLHEFGTRVVPRLLFEHAEWSIPKFKALGSSPQPLIDEIILLCKQFKFEGVVVEIWQALLSTGMLSASGSIDEGFHLVKTLGQSLREADIMTVLVLPPYNQDVAQHGVTADRMQDVGIAYSYFVAMTYDFTNLGAAPGPMAPSPWVRSVGEYLAQKCGLKEKVLLGLNFYGVDFFRRPNGERADQGESRHVVGHEVIDLLERHKSQLWWLPDVEEHAYFYAADGINRVVFYPTRRSISKRLAIASDVGCGGVAIWDLGQGLDHFFEEF